MNSAPTKLLKAGTTQPRWGWSGVSELKRTDRELHLQQVVAMLPTMKSSDAQVLGQLVELGVRFHGWLHQDEFGPGRREQTAALRAHIKLVRELCQQLKKGTSRSRDRLDAALRSSNDGLSPAVAALGEAAADVESALLIASSKDKDIGWFSRMRGCAATLFAQIEILDDNTGGQIELTALYRNFKLSQTVAFDEFALADAERWFNGYWNVLVETLNTLSDQRGAQERVSLKLLVEELCVLYERETGQLVTAHAIKEDVYTSQVETLAGRFVTAAVEAMLPDQLWFDRHSQFADPVCAATFLLDEHGNTRQAARARQILTTMRNFVARRAPKVARPSKI
jgi:hypothetical protein